MKSLKTLLLGTTLAAGAAFMLGTSAFADTTYTVQSGDTLSTISNKFAGSNELVQQIAEKNSIGNVNMIYVGEQLTIPTGDTAQAAPAQAQTQQAAPVQQTETVQTEQTTQTQTAQTVETTTTTETAAAATETTATASTTNSAKEWIAQKESSGSYTATNGRYVGRYQLDSSYLNGDYSAANQERVADQYVTSRYGSWEAAQAFWMANGWY
ncbi:MULTISPECIES: LysM peptidoglycan-binding domain-containing protein [unclassified Enterococcus]|jgi:LysM repeat protein|uniref:aggregation-promoting factor n=1 Tax=unclassified Enterococcus TaxID=2608891 RepID=UPI003D2E84BC